MNFNQLIEKQQENASTMVEKAVNAAIVLFAKNLAAHSWEEKKYTQAELKKIMKGEATPAKAKKAAKKAPAKSKKAAAKDDDESEEEELKLPKGMTKARWAKICDAFGELEDGQCVNVKTTKIVKNKKSKAYEDYYFRKNFCGPQSMKAVVLWAVRNEPEAEDEESGEFEKLDVETSEDEESEDEESDDETSEDEESEDEQPKKAKKKVQLPQGLTPKKLEKIQETYNEIDEDHFVNVKTGNVVKNRKSKVYNEYFFKGYFCAPASLKKAVLWCNSNIE